METVTSIIAILLVGYITGTQGLNVQVKPFMKPVSLVQKMSKAEVEHKYSCAPYLDQALRYPPALRSHLKPELFCKEVR